MKSKYLLYLLIVLLAAGCATFSELEPDPEVSPAEGGYTELKDDDENFELEKGDKYFIKFPPPSTDNFFLVLKLDNATALGYYFTDTFDDGEGPRNEIQDEYATTDTMNVYDVEPGPETYYWVIDNVSSDTHLKMVYRYVPQWRFQFEEKYVYYRDELQGNSVSRDIYNRIGPGFDVSSVDYSDEIDKVSKTLGILNDLKEEFAGLESVFPSNIANSNDEAYQNYLLLKEQLDDELKFQQAYLKTLKVYQSLNDTMGNGEEFVNNTELYLDYLQNAEGVKSDAVRRAKEIINSRQNEITRYLMTILRQKNDLTKIEIGAEAERLSELFSEAGTLDPELRSVTGYIARFNEEIEAINETKNGLDDLNKFFITEGSWPSNGFYADAISRLRDVAPSLPESRASQMNGFRDLAISRKLSDEISGIRRRINNNLEGYRLAAQIVPQINEMRRAENYRGIIELLSQNKNMPYLLDQYPDIDLIYVEKLKDRIAFEIKNRNWKSAEEALEELHNADTFVNYNSIKATKNRIVNEYETKMYQEIKEASKQRVDLFVQKNTGTIENVDRLYQDSVFTPVYRITWASGGQEELRRRRAEIDNYLDRMKHYYFPEQSIEAIYRSFISNPQNQGVAKCRAIVAHGKQYKGDNEKIKNIIGECDIDVPKWITKPKVYRKLYTYPVTDNKTGNNEYKFRLQLQIPSDAEFPVYDINIKLPEEVAKNAGSERWYKSITLDGKEIKIEGRIKITSPSAENNYEFQVSPVQMEKGGSNILEARFVFPDYKVFEVSVMAQKPIIKKN